MVRRKQNGSAAHLSALQQDLEALQRDMRLLVGKIASATSERVADTATGAANEIEGWASNGADSVREMIRSQPLAAIALSMSAGAALSFLLRRA